MAEATGTARQEAERLVATVLAMASQAGLGDAPKDRESAGSPGLTDMISGLVGQFLGGASDNPPPATPRQHRDSADHTDGEYGAGGQGRAAEDSGHHGADRQSTDPRGSGARQDAGQHGGGQRSTEKGSTEKDGAAGRGHGRQQGAGQQLWDVLGGFGGWSTGSAECCVCPICRAIAGVRDPSPEQAERLATGAGEFASGVASLLRAFSVVAGTTGGSNRRKPPARPTTTPDQAWSAATRRTTPADSTPPHHEVREGDDPWTAATRAPRPQPADAPAARAAAPTDATARAAAAQAATQTDATGLADTADRTGAAGSVDTQAQTDGAGMSAADVRRQGDPWAAATRAPRRPAPTRTAGTAAAGGASAEAAAFADAELAGVRGSAAVSAEAGMAAADGASAQVAASADAEPATDRAGRAGREPIRDPAAASEGAGARTGKVGEAGAGAGKVWGIDVWAAATAADSDTAGDTGVADGLSVDHDVPGTAPAASAAEGRGAVPGGAARAGDAV
ncbi:hypothetical protein DMB66_25270 [Actinoplanes sp. ATCC 53533]|uniref:hypothetical protein n=1 Tax=Actinoplanes sp. ATCC 53533 TaxID=1288362 RepID=UPI000F7814FB|nr:hypothetical protein [Actinoplanes sp. ATCC 53533]RSM60188.1 hypothetical protein DMB66_25270 [Actinoplanes sp. ATCC 53533]